MPCSTAESVLTTSFNIFNFRKRKTEVAPVLFHKVGLKFACAQLLRNWNHQNRKKKIKKKLKASY